ncbi:MAG: lamin tail domain-containing protein [Candidatus Delongbacteria bacterium]|nr:lamin tail domain-containing protein [Candidatus Delongbacteria bacterium]
MSKAIARISLWMVIIFALGSMVVVADSVKMNEIFSQGTATDPDWIELYNPGTADADISGYKIYDSGGQSGSKSKKSIPAGTVIPAKGFYVIVTDTDDESGFGLSKGGEAVWLENAVGTVIDTVVFGSTTTTQSYGRIPDGGVWQVIDVITRGSANSPGSPVVTILMNEVFSQGTATDPDWIELYNPGTIDADISGYKIYDSGGQSGSKTKKSIPAGTVIPAKGFYVIVTDTDDSTGFGLSKGGEAVWLENAEGSIMDTVVFESTTATQSYSRIPDGGVWQVTDVITRGNANSAGIPEVLILMNEVYSRGTSEAPDWVELYNPGSADIDISGYKIYDSGGQSGSKPKKSIPAGTTIPAKGYYVMVTDTDDESGFGLTTGGEWVWLENSSGQVIDSVLFASMEDTQSYSRIPDGGVWQITTIITRGSANAVEMAGGSVVMNEVYSRGTADNPDWIELYNPGSETVDLSGYLIYDSGGKSGSKSKKGIPAGTIIPAKGYYIMVTDTDDESGFGLSSGGETAWLENAAGVLIDSVNFTAMDTNQSYSRIPDGGTWQLVNTITRGFSNSPTSISDPGMLSSRFRLEQNYPNPFNPSTRINYTITSSAHVKLTVYDVLGRELVRLVDTRQGAGSYAVTLDASCMAAGMYFYRLESDGKTQIRKMILMK